MGGRVFPALYISRVDVSACGVVRLVNNRGDNGYHLPHNVIYFITINN